jgi:methanethiol S-methyltransferase
MIPLLLALILWAVVHSITAGSRTKAYIRQRFGERAYKGTYRLAYNIISAVTLLPVFYLLATAVPDGSLWSVPMPYRLLNYAAQIAGLVGLAASLLQTDVWSFTGLRQFMRFLQGEVDPDPPAHFVSSGTYAVVRHPLYFFSLLFLWGRPDMTLSSLILNIWVTLYFLIGSIYEERRLLKEFGDAYQVYQNRVPRLFPLRLPGYSGERGK